MDAQDIVKAIQQEHEQRMQAFARTVQRRAVPSAMTSPFVRAGGSLPARWGNRMPMWLHA